MGNKAEKTWRLFKVLRGLSSTGADAWFITREQEEDRSFKRASWSMSHSNQDAQQGFQEGQNWLSGIALACIMPRI
jgi:hypothetical protein